jgi:hypothetical protein
MGFACVHRGQDLPTIWDYFNKLKGKNINNYRCHITTRMKQWAYDRHMKIDKSIYLEQDAIKAIVDLKFNPGKGSPTYCLPQRASLFSRAGHVQVQKRNAFMNVNMSWWPWKVHASLVS